MKQQIIKLIEDFVKEYPTTKKTESSWREAVIGFASADNPKFRELKEIISPSHDLPTDFIADAKSIIAYFMPFTEDVVQSNAETTKNSREWDIINIETNNLIIDVGTFLKDTVGKEGYKLEVIPPTDNYNKQTFISHWSHRHIAYIAGIGMFGINNMLITEKGCCGRIGSVVTNIVLEADETQTEEACLYKYNGSCKKCVKNCLVDSISIKEESVCVDKNKCYTQVYTANISEYPIGLGQTCGKCMCNVPCATQNPVDKIKNH